ncbi:hypothetical protein P3T36_000546 [Kitasatospora sp. MAP12-15]|uniref:DUF2398 family protein n=1 Tax=unclassified Kitasatospora TaxID=2633591 RepID=UPI002476DAAA|nr:DUF2398 family protein [Kitasatospora sp. MAP12-44]MDH6114145.1 hypothetical protein [Kitasatospora sp. MAP12-44]
MNGGGGLGSADLPRRTGAPAGLRSLALTEVDAVGDVLTLLQPDPEPAPRPQSSAGYSVARESARRLVRLARRFARADEQQAHDLFAAAFGLHGPRHFGVAPEPDAADLGRLSWWHGPTVRQPVAGQADALLPRPRGARRRSASSASSPSIVSPASTAAAPAADRSNPGRHRKPEPPVADDAGRALAAERRAAARLLLAHPLVTATGPNAEAFALIRRHAHWLADRFDRLLGYPLTVTDAFARLRKAGAGPGALHRLDLDGVPCPPETYAALALALSVLLAGPERRPAGQLAEVIAAAAGAAGIGELVGPAAVAAALALLTRWQVLTEPAGPAPAGELLVDHALAAALGPVPSEPGGLAVVDVPVAVRRRLAETPVVLLAELTALEREWLWDARQREAETFAEFLGLTAEIRREGIALLDPAGELTDLRLPSAAAPAHAALLLVEHLVEQLRPLPESAAAAEAVGVTGVTGLTGVPIPEALIDGTLGDVADEYGAAAGWCRDHLADRAAFRREVLELLHRMRLIAPLEPTARLTGTQGPRGRAAGGWMLLAPAARYAVQAELRPAPGTGRHSRREDEFAED